MAMPTLRSEIKIFLLAAFWAVFSWGYFDRFPLPGFLVKIYLMMLASLVAASAWGLGSLLISRSLLTLLSIEEALVITTVTGFGVLSLSMFVMGAFNLWTRLGAIILIGIGLFAAWPRWKAAKLFSTPGDWDRTKIDKVPLFLIMIGVGLSALITFSPVTYYDSLVYHFKLPQIYIQSGHWIGETELIYSTFPQMMEMIWTLGMLLAGDVMANLLGWIIAMLGVGAVYSFGKRFLGRKTAGWSAALLLTMPAYLLLSSGGYIDVGLTVYAFLSFYLLCLWASLSPRDPLKTQFTRLLSLSGFLAGCAISSKYTGAIPWGIGALFILWQTSSLKLNKMMACQAIYSGSALLVFSPWLLKNLYYVGNPIFPFFYECSLKQLNPWMQHAATGYFRGLTEYTPRSGWKLFKLVWDIAVNGLNFGGGMDVLGDLGWAPLFVLLPTLFFVRKYSSTISRLLMYSACFFIPWGITRPVLRFLLPIAPFLALGAAYGYDQGIGSQVKGVRLATRVFLAILLLSNFRAFFDVADALSLFRVPLGFESRSEYLAEKLNYFEAASFVNTLPDDSLTYVIGDQRGYYYNKPVLVTPVFNSNPFTDWANEADSGEQLAAHLKARHVTHLLVNHTEMARLDPVYHLFPFTPKGQANWDKLRSGIVKRVYRDSHCEVFSLP